MKHIMRSGPFNEHHKSYSTASKNAPNNGLINGTPLERVTRAQYLRIDINPEWDLSREIKIRIKEP